MIWKQCKKGRSRFEARILLAVLVIVGLGAITYTASGAERDRLLSGRTRYFDPFRLTTIYLDVLESEPMADIASVSERLSSPRVTPAIQVTANNNNNGRRPIFIPGRPTIRSNFRPDWVPGPPPWGPPGPPSK